MHAPFKYGTKRLGYDGAVINGAVDVIRDRYDIGCAPAQAIAVALIGCAIGAATANTRPSHGGLIAGAQRLARRAGPDRMKGATVTGRRGALRLHRAGLEGEVADDASGNQGDGPLFVRFVAIHVMSCRNPCALRARHRSAHWTRCNVAASPCWWSCDSASPPVRMGSFPPEGCGPARTDPLRDAGKLPQTRKRFPDRLKPVVPSLGN